MPGPTLATGVRVRLSIMMFLQYAFQGIWIIPLGFYLGSVGYSDAEIGSVYGTIALGCIIAPFFVGMIADRFFSAQKVLGVMNLAAGVLLFLASQRVVTADGKPQFGVFWWLILGHCICYMPTWALTNAIALNQMTNPGRQFPSIRVMGTIGWVFVSTISLFSKQITGMMGYEGNIEATRLPMLFGSGIGILAGVLSFIMPSTPPKKTGTKITFGDIIGIKALRLFKDRNFCVFALCSFLIVLPGLFYWNWCNFYLNEIHWPAVQFKQSIGQMAETVFLFIMPFFFARLGVKMMLLIGMLAWVVRFACFGYGDTDAMVFLLYTGLALHGVCFDFFFVTGQLYTDAKAPKEVQASAQGLITLMTFGLGWWGGSNLSGWIIGKYVTKTEVVNGVTKVLEHNWRAIWHYPLIMAAVITVIFVALFNDKLVVGRAKPGELS